MSKRDLMARASSNMTTRTSLKSSRLMTGPMAAAALDKATCTDCGHTIGHHEGGLKLWAAMSATRRGRRSPGTLRCSVVVKGRACRCGKAKSKPCPRCGGTGLLKT